MWFLLCCCSTEIKSLIIRMFKFFPEDEGEGIANKDPSINNKEETLLRPCEEVEHTQLHYDLASNVPSSSLISKTNINIKFLKIQELINSPLVEDKKVKEILGSTSDLQPGQYEGGFKLWECTLDLLDYAEENLEELGLSKDSRALDLGCGHGLLGIYGLTKGALVLFQDYNKEVLDFLTIPNVIANLGDEGLSRSRFFSGSWGSLKQLMDEGEEGKREGWKFDVILSSETIYNTDYLQDFIELVQTCLKPDGSLFLAAKTCYFGVGGGTKAFVTMLINKTNMNVKTVKVIKNGIQREILKVTKS